MRKLLTSFIVTIFLFLTGCNTNLTESGDIRYKDEIFSEVNVTKDITYGENINSEGNIVDLKMDIYEPSNDDIKRRALIIFIHGGGFVSGDKGKGVWPRLCWMYAKKGYVTASIDYRLQTRGNNNTGKAVIQAMHDAKAVVRYFRAYSDMWDIDDKKIILAGGSAGATTALYVTYLTEPEYDGKSGNQGYSSNVSACINLWGGLFDKVNEIDTGESPVLIIHGTEDDIVPFSEATKISKRCDKVGVYCELYPLEGEMHAPWEAMMKYIPNITEFLYNEVINEDLHAEDS